MKEHFFLVLLEVMGCFYFLLLLPLLLLAATDTAASVT
jgi:hypothetical protein